MFVTSAWATIDNATSYVKRGKVYEPNQCFTELTLKLECNI